MRGNLVVSPLSVYDVLALLAPGARGDSFELLQRALHASEDGAALLRSAAALRRELSGENDMLRIASAAWLQLGYAVHSEYVALLSDADAPPRFADFHGDALGACAEINAWITENTAGRIHDLVSPPAIHSDTRLVLADGIALDAPWAERFVEAETREQVFHAPTADHAVQMMRKTAVQLYAQGAGFSAVRVPYERGLLEALIALPDDPGADPLALLPSLTGPAARDAFSPRAVALGLPRFDLGSTIDLYEPLADLGLAPLFDGTRADLSGIGGQPGDLWVDRALHQALLTVEEKGTKGAAAAVVTVRAISQRIYPNPIPFTADRPFLFAVVDAQGGVPVFVARVIDPA